METLAGGIITVVIKEHGFDYRKKTKILNIS